MVDQSGSFRGSLDWAGVSVGRPYRRVVDYRSLALSSSRLRQFSPAADGVEPEVIAAIHHAAKHVPEVLEVRGVKARWTGHRLQAELQFRLPELSVVEAQAIATAVREQLHHLSSSRQRFVSSLFFSFQSLIGTYTLPPPPHILYQIRFRGCIRLQSKPCNLT